MRKKIPQEPNDAAECLRLRELLAHQSPKLRIEIVQDELALLKAEKAAGPGSLFEGK